MGEKYYTGGECDFQTVTLNCLPGPYHTGFLACTWAGSSRWSQDPGPCHATGRLEGAQPVWGCCSCRGTQRGRARPALALTGAGCAPSRWSHRAPGAVVVDSCPSGGCVPSSWLPARACRVTHGGLSAHLCFCLPHEEIELEFTLLFFIFRIQEKCTL